MRKILFLCGALVLTAAWAGGDDWVYDTSKRPSETVSKGAATLSGVMDSRSLSSVASDADAVDSRYLSVETSEETHLNTNPRGLFLIVR